MAKTKKYNALEDYLFPSTYSKESKKNVLDFLLNINPDTSGYLTKEIGFKKFFPTLYTQFKEFPFLQECDNWTFTQKLYHFMRDDKSFILGICEECHKNRCDFNNFKIGYKRFCSLNCSSSNEHTISIKNNTIITKYGSVDNFNAIRLEHLISHNRKKYGMDIWTNREKAEKTFMYKYGEKSYMSTNDFRKKSKEYYRQNYGCDNNSQIDGWKEKFAESFSLGATKGYNTKKKNGTLTSSKIEENIKNYLKNKDIKYIRQYKSQLYPFACDFYLSDYDLYIEIQGHWSHGKHPYNMNCNDDNIILKKWRNKGSEQYLHAIDIWTQRDPLKRKTAKENNLNYLEIFSTDLNKCIFQIEQKIKELEN